MYFNIGLTGAGDCNLISSVVSSTAESGGVTMARIVKKGDNYSTERTR